MKRTFLTEHPGPFLIFGDMLYPTHSDAAENYVARPTLGGESRLGFRDPIPLMEIEANDFFSKKPDNSEYLNTLVMPVFSNFSIDPQEYIDRLATLAFVVGEVFPMLVDMGKPGKQTGHSGRHSGKHAGKHKAARAQEATPQIYSPDRVISRFTSSKYTPVDSTTLLDMLRTEELQPYIETLPSREILDLAFPEGMFPPAECSLLAKVLRFTPVYCADDGNERYAHVLRTSRREGSERIHLHGNDFYWDVRERLSWIDEVYLQWVHRKLRSDKKADLEKLMAARAEAASQAMHKYEPLLGVPEFSYKNLTVRWISGRCFLTMKFGKFARQDFEVPNKWHGRPEFEVGIGIHYSRGTLHFTDYPVGKIDGKDICFNPGTFGIFRYVCSQIPGEWTSFEKTADGAALYIRTAADRMLNGFSPEIVKAHYYGFGEYGMFRDIFPLEKAFTANTLDEVRNKWGQPANFHLPFDKGAQNEKGAENVK